MGITYHMFVGVSIAIYMVSFFAKNSITAKQTGQSVKGKSWKVNALIFVIGMLYTLTYVCVFFKYNFLYCIEFLDLSPIKTTGIVLIAIALIIGLSTLITMKDSWRMGITPGQKTELVVNGLFRFSRNPFFISYILIFLGVFLVYPTVVFLFFYIPFAIITHLMILDEEKYLVKQHGDLYLDYKKSVQRYIPVRIKIKSTIGNCKNQ